jgi:hypothetical protein
LFSAAFFARGAKIAAEDVFAAENGEVAEVSPVGPRGWRRDRLHSEEP